MGDEGDLLFLGTMAILVLWVVLEVKLGARRYETGDTEAIPRSAPWRRIQTIFENEPDKPVRTGDKSNRKC